MSPPPTEPETAPGSESPPRPPRLWPGACGVAGLVLVLMLATNARLGLAWDEAYTIARLDRVRTWCAAVVDPPAVAARFDPKSLRPVEDRRLRPPTARQIRTRGALFEPKTLDWFWPFAREEPHGHPPFYAIVALLGDVVLPGFPELTRARFGTLFAFSLAAGALFGGVGRRYGTWPGLVAAGAWALHPHLFALGHYATYDALLSSLWVGAVLAFARAVGDGPSTTTAPAWPRWPAVVGFGVLLGFAMGTKLTGWLLPIPLAAWVLLRRDRAGLITLAAGGLVALVTVYVVTPPFWADPIGGVQRFLASNLSRAETIPIRTQFLGTVYETPKQSLPWYNTLAWTLFVTPVGFLLLGLMGAGRAARRWRTESLATLALANWAFLMVLRALPHAPGHDGVRQFLPAFGCLALLAGVGAASVLERFGPRARLALAAALVEGLLSVLVMLPVPLSYYSPLIGGLPGATALGMEPTYYWDAMTDEALRDLDARTPPGGVVLFLANPIAWTYHDQGRLKADPYRGDGRSPSWYVLQNRPGALSPIERKMIARLGSDPTTVLSAKFGVPLVWALPGPQVDALFAAERPSAGGGRP